MNSSEIANFEIPTYFAKTCGTIAFAVISSDASACVIGITSKGIFLETDHQQLFFISSEASRGPLTINLSHMIDIKSRISLEEKCTLEKDQIIFDNCTITIDENTTIWQPSPIHFIKNKIAEVQDRCKQLAVEIMDNYSEGLFSPFLEKVIHMFAEKWGNQALHLEEIWRRLPGLKHNQPTDLSQRFMGLIGLGSGLTPAGDDFLIGFLLASHNLANITPTPICQKAFQTHIIEEAKRRTTTLSAALIQCAAEGVADERLMKTLSWLAQGSANIQQVKADLLSYGSSSGVDSFAGMLAAILLFSTRLP